MEETADKHGTTAALWGLRGAGCVSPWLTGAQAGGPGLLTCLDGGLPPQQELEALGVVRQAAVVQGSAALPCLLIQVPTGQEQGQRKRTISESQARGPALPSQAGAWAREQERQQAVEPPSGGFLAILLRGGGMGAPGLLVQMRRSWREASRELVTMAKARQRHPCCC